MVFIDAPLHPEYPSAHAILAAVTGTLLQHELGAAPTPVLVTSSPTAKGASRRWPDTESLMHEVAEARILEGIHYRFFTDTGLDMGRRIGRLTASALLPPEH